MKLSGIFALFSLSVLVKGTWWAAAVQPVILSLGAVLSAIDLDGFDIQTIELRNLLPFINKQEKITKEEKPTGPPVDKEQLKENMLNTVKEGGMTEKEEQEVLKLWIEMKKGDIAFAEKVN